MADVPEDLIVLPREATPEMMNAAVAAARAKPPNSRGEVGHVQIRAAYAAFYEAFVKQVEAGRHD